MVQIKSFLVGLLFYFIGQIGTYYQLNGQFLWPWAKRNPLVLALFGIPISIIFIWATKHTVDSFGGLMWPQRFVGFASGMLVYAWGTSYYFNQPIDTKTAVSLFIALLLICIQLFWK